MTKYVLDFEKTIKSIEDKILSLKNSPNKNHLSDNKLSNLEEQLDREIINTYSNLNRWEKVQLARHPFRPHSIDYIENIVENWL